MSLTEDNDSTPAGSRGELLRRLAKKLISVTGNDKLNRKLSGRGAARIFNVLDEASEFVLKDLVDGKKLKITGLRDNEDEYFKDEDNPRFKQFVQKFVKEREEDGLATSREFLRTIKDKVRDLMGLPSSEELIPNRNIDLIYGDRENVQKGRHVDDELQTDLDFEDAQKSLRKIEADRVHILRERGLDSLFIAFGFLEWKKEDPVRKSVKNFNSAICLMEVSLETDKKKENFKIVSNGDLVENSDLIEALKQDTGIDPPSLKDYWIEERKGYSFSLEKYHDAFRHYIRKYKGWNVRNRIAVGIFKSRGIGLDEIDPNNYTDETVDRTEALLAGSGYRAEPNSDRDVDKPKDRALVPAFALPVDSSQHAAILEAAEGRDMVIEGPPGTGKSHTIVNLIADALRTGKSVLFLAQKIVALDVVYNRLSEKELGLDKKCLRLYSKQATRTVLYGKSGELSKKMAPIRESLKNELDKTCKQRDDCLTELNDFAHLMLKEIHGEIYQNILTTFKTLEHFIGTEEKPFFRLRDSFDLKEKDVDLNRIKEISEILAEFDKPAKQLLKHIRCKETDPFKVEGLINDSKLVLDALEPFLNHYGEQTIESAKSNEAKFSFLLDRRILMDRTFDDLKKSDTFEKRNDNGLFDQALLATALCESHVDEFDSKTGQTKLKDAQTLLNELLECRSQCELESNSVSELLNKVSENLPDFSLQSLKSNRNLHENLTFPNDLKFYDLDLILADQQSIESAEGLILEFNDKINSIHKICSEVLSKNLLNDLSNVLKKHKDFRQSLENQIEKIAASLSSVSSSIGNYSLKVSDSIHNSKGNHPYPKELQFFDVKLIKNDILELKSAKNLSQKARIKRAKVESLIKEFKTSKELSYHFKILENKRFSSLSCRLPFSKASKSRKLLQSLFKENIPFKELRKSCEDLIANIQIIETSESKLKQKELFFSEAKLAAAQETLFALIPLIESTHSDAENLASEGFIDSTIEVFESEEFIIQEFQDQITNANSNFLLLSDKDSQETFASNGIDEEIFGRFAASISKLPIAKSIKPLIQSCEQLDTLYKSCQSIKVKLHSTALLVSEEKILDCKECLLDAGTKTKAISNLTKILSDNNYLEDTKNSIQSECHTIESIIEKVCKIDEIKSELKKNKLNQVSSTDIKRFVEAFSLLHETLEKASSIAEDLECNSQPEKATEINEFLNSVINSQTFLSKIFAINSILDEIDESKGIGDWLRTLFDQDTSLTDKYKAHLYRFITQKISQKDRKVFQYKKKYYENLKKEFAELDKQSRLEFAHSLRTTMPIKREIPNKKGRLVSEHEGLSLLEHVSNRNARVTVRELCHRAIDAMKSYCSCFFMTPSSVANYMPRDTEFDLVIIDEASQMLPEEAVGSILRSKQVIVVGDPMQMPPYKGMVTTLHDEEYDDFTQDDGLDKQTSILDLAAECFVDYRRLRYHYRSEDENLIKFSNHEFYGNDLITIPNQHENLELGVKFFAAGGTYNPGKEGGSKNPNEIEAEKLVDLIIKETREHPEWSLGVAVINKQQALRVEEILRKKTLHDSKFSKFISKWAEGSNYFFIKNLENVQGDERDTMIISTVYGRDKDGKVHNHFGPIIKPKGENRINVLVTRAKKRIVVCSSMHPNDITGASKGAQVLRRYLQYAMTGEMDGTSLGSVDECDHYYDAPWEKWFHDRLEADGFIVDPQVGVSSWRIDLGVKHNDYPAGYICGIELDGPDHLSLSARDRDIERQSILERKGWTIFRVWSMDFFNDMEGEYQIIKKAIESTLREKVATLKIEPEPKFESQVEKEVSTASPSQILGY